MFTGKPSYAADRKGGRFSGFYDFLPKSNGTNLWSPQLSEFFDNKDPQILGLAK